MKVELIAYTEGADHVCNLAAKNCVSEEMPELFEMDAEGFVHLVDEECRSLRHALESGHESVAEHAVFTFSIEGISRACSHQLVRHRMASYSQQSQRYVKMNGFDYVTPESIDSCRWSEFKGYSEHKEPMYETLQDDYEWLMEKIASIYRTMIDHGIPEEDARYILPNACCTNIVVTMNGRELRHFFKLRCCNRAQWEIRELADKMLEQVKEVAPILFENAGPQCKKLGYCPEAKGCGRYPPKVEALGLDMCVLSEVEE